MAAFQNTSTVDSFWTDAGRKYVSLIGAILSIIGLLLNAISFQTAKFLGDYNSSMVFIRMLAVWDSISILQDGIINLGGKFFGFDLSVISSAVCKMYYFHSWGSSFSANYHLVALCFDRFLAIKFPIWYRTNGKPKFAYSVSIGVVLLNYGICSLLIYFCELINDACVMTGQEVLLYWYIRINCFVIFSGLPFFIILFINIHFVLYLRKSRKSRSSSQKNKRDVHEQRLVVMLMTVSFFFLLFSLTCGTISAFYIQLIPTTPSEVSLSGFLEVVLEIPSIMNSSMNFIFFFLSGKGYRDACRKMLKSIL